MSYGHVLLFISRLAFVFVGSSFSLFIVRAGDTRADARRASRSRSGPSSRSSATSSSSRTWRVPAWTGRAMRSPTSRSAVFAAVILGVAGLAGFAAAPETTMPPVYLNHVYRVLDTETFRAADASEYLRTRVRARSSGERRSPATTAGRVSTSTARARTSSSSRPIRSATARWARAAWPSASRRRGAAPPSGRRSMDSASASVRRRRSTARARPPERWSPGSR